MALQNSEPYLGSVITGAALGTLVSGLLFGLSLIVAIGPQNAFIVRQGALRRHVTIVVAICAVSDIVLIAVGVSGTGAALAGRPWLRDVTRALGAAVLLVYAALAARRALDGSAIDRSSDPGRSTRAAAVAACLAFTWLNPGVYLDTIVLLGSVAHTQAPRQWWFGAGAAIASVVWFAALAAAAWKAHAQLTRPRVWRAMDSFVALVMTVTALRLLVGF
ncbi:MAG TPA: LysE family transporter [Solirubrobacteraceae bacterium]|jgi:L-lysine exporter family protein LysE/ArgO